MSKKDNGYKIVSELFERQQDFIVVGLCGKTGSGVSTIADILQKEFNELNLSLEAPQEFSDYERHEYHILYDFAQKNWNKFYLVKTRALIVASVLSYKQEEFCEFLYEVAGLTKDEGTDATGVVKSFFDARMTFEIDKEFMLAEKHSTSTPKFQFHEFFDCDRDPLESKDLRLNIRGISQGTNIVEIPNVPQTIKLVNGKNITISYDTKQKAFTISNVDLYKLFRDFQKCRETKKGNLNPIYYWILQKYIFAFLSETVTKFWDALKKIKKFEKIETLAMQLLGNNLRISDRPYAKYEDDNGATAYYAFQEKGYVTIAKDINHSIKILRAYLSKKAELKSKDSTQDNETIHKHALVVVDSIKNPFESMYLKQRYSNYYLMGIYTDEAQRQKRLINSNKFSMDDINTIDRVEQLRIFKKYYRDWCDKKLSEKEQDPVLEIFLNRIKEQRLEDVLPFILQNVSSCLESADIFINNPIDNSSYVTIKRTMVRYISLMMCPGIVLPTNLERCMQIAYASKANSGCISRQVGAVVTDCDYQLLSVGWNQQPREQLPCLYRDLCELYAHHDPDGYSDYENSSEGGETSFQKNIQTLVTEEYNKQDCPLKTHGRNVCFCFKDVYNGITGEKNQMHTRALHAEETAFLNLTGDSKQRAKGGFLFTTSSPCVLCAKKSRYLGISKIYYVDPYPDISYSHVLMAGPVKSRPEFILFTGAIGTAYTRLFTPLLPIKDERELWLGHKIWVPEKNEEQQKSEEKKEVDRCEQ